MKVIVSGHHINVGDALRTHIEQSLDKHVSKYFEHAIHATVNMIMDKPHLIKADIVINEGTGHGSIIMSSSEDADAYRAFDQAVVKAEKQLRRYKGRIKNHRKNKEEMLSHFQATKYTMSPFADEDQANQNLDAPAIIAEKSTTIEQLTVGDAVMKMDLLDLPALLFINSGNGRLNMVYYRKDGNISWVDAAVNQ